MLVQFNSTACHARARIAWGRLGLQIVRVGVNDHASSNNGIRAFEAEGLDEDLQFCVPRGIRGDVAEVARVPLHIMWATVFRDSGIEMRSGR